MARDPFNDPERLDRVFGQSQRAPATKPKWVDGSRPVYAYGIEGEHEPWFEIHYWEIATHPDIGALTEQIIALINARSRDLQGSEHQQLIARTRATVPVVYRQLQEHLHSGELQPPEDYREHSTLEERQYHG